VPTKPRSDAAWSWPAIAAAGLVFAVLATLNAGGYRYGASDQAFYIPAILHQIDPTLFPRDWAMIGAQGRYFLLDELVAGLMRTSGVSLPAWFAVLQVATLTSLFAGAWLLGRALLTTPWAMTAWIAALTLRHRIAKTGVNTLEGYFHPRVLVCGLGLVSIALFLRGRPWWALGVAAASGALHPTTAACFVVIIGTAMIVTMPAARAPIGGTAIGLLAVTGFALWRGSGFFDVTVMDDAWRALVATKDYTFPTDWSGATWALNLLGPALLTGAVVARHRAGLATPAERGVVAGCLLLVVGFLASLPFIASGVALAVQLQTSRVFWPVELLATLMAIWWVCEAPAASRARPWLARALALVLVATSVMRGVYVGFVESPSRPTLAFDLPDDDWGAALAWVRAHTPRDAFVLADPGHAWKFGTAVRIGAERDVYLEETKDVAMAMYSKAAAAQVAARIDQVAGFDGLDEAAILALARRDGLTLLVTERRLQLPVIHVQGAVTVYRLGS
jgi:hypothetical protein